MTTLSQSLALEKKITLAICEKVGTPRALAVSLLVKHGEFTQLLDLDIRPSLYQNAGDFADDYLVTKVLSKSSSLPLGWDTKMIAVESFQDSERHCRKTNDRLQEMDFPPWVARTRKMIARILGPLNADTLLDIERLCAHGPGGCAGVKAAGMCRSDKFDARPTVTPELAPYAQALMGETWFDYRPHLVEVEGSQFFTVPKNAKTDRGCALEPNVNQWLQKGIGRHLARRLRLFGVDIRDQSWNQHLASMAHVLGLATIDLSMASDLISFVLIFRLLPRRWFQLLSLARSRYITMPDGGGPILLEKFCTMGNGFTFALETIIFFAVCKAVCAEGSLVSAYGDDLIVPQSDAMAVVNALEFLGFKVNGAKSCLAGNFFESCGTDWFDGINVRPFFLKGTSEEERIPYEVTSANALRRWAHRRCGGVGCDARFQSVWEEIFQASPASWQRCATPPAAGDCGFTTDVPKGSKCCSADYQREWYRYRSISSIPEVKDKRTFGTLLNGIDSSTREPDVLYDIEFPPPSLSRRDDVRWLLSQLATDTELGRPTYGLEPRRGLYGLSRPRWAYCDSWPDGWAWI